MLAVAVVALLCGQAGAAFAGPNEEIKHRKLVIGTVGNMMVSISTALKGDLEQANQIPAMARTAATAATMTKDAFRVNTAGKGTEKTTVKGDLIWRDWADFSKRMDELQAATANLATVAARGDRKATGEAMRPVFATCKGCHDKYRE
jgi:cytochrome c556